jgi:hypothetical protein
VLEGEKDVNSIIYYLYDLVCWKIFYIWLKSILGNHEITLYDYFLSILIGMVVGGLMYIAFPLLIIGGIIGLVTSHS